MCIGENIPALLSIDRAYVFVRRRSKKKTTKMKKNSNVNKTQLKRQ